MQNLNEGKKKKASAYMAELAEIDKQSAIVAMEAKINHLQEMADKKNERLKMVSEDENLSELIDSKKKKSMEREIKEIEKAKAKLEKVYEKMSGGKKKEIVDEDKEDMDETYSASTYEEDDSVSEGGYDSTYEEDDMKESTNEEYLRMQKLAGVISEEEYKNRLNEAAGENLELKNLAKQLYLGFKKMGADASLIDSQKVKQIGKKDGLSYDNKDVLITVGKDGTGNDLVVVVFIGDKALGFEDKIKKDFKQFEFVDGVSRDSASWKKLGVKTKELLIKPGKTTSE